LANFGNPEATLKRFFQNWTYCFIRLPFC